MSSRPAMAVTASCGLIARALMPVLHCGPHLVHAHLWPCAIKNVEVLPGHGIRVRYVGALLHVRVILLPMVLGTPEDNYVVAGIPAWAPEKVVLVAADRIGEPVLRPEQVDCAGLPEILREDGRLWPHFGRQG